MPNPEMQSIKTPQRNFLITYAISTKNCLNM